MRSRRLRGVACVRCEGGLGRRIGLRINRVSMREGLKERGGEDERKRSVLMLKAKWIAKIGRSRYMQYCGSIGITTSLNSYDFIN